MTPSPAALTWHRHPSTAAADAALAASLAGDLGACIESNGRATIGLSGGSTPRKMLGCLAQADVDWSRVTVLLVDERWCPHDAPESNFGMIRGALGAAAEAATMVPMWSDRYDLHGAARAAAAELAPYLPLDVLTLGMGLDGHTASWIPGSEGLEDALRGDASAVRAVIPSDGRSPRLTLTRPVIVGAQRRYLQIYGREKASVLEAATRAVDPSTSPVQAAFEGAPLRVFWAPKEGT